MALPSTVSAPTWSEVFRTDVKVQTCMARYPRNTHDEVVKVQSQCYRTLHVENVAVYIGSDQLWTLQLREGLLYLASGIILLGGRGLTFVESSRKTDFG